MENIVLDYKIIILLPKIINCKCVRKFCFREKWFPHAMKNTLLM